MRERGKGRERDRERSGQSCLQSACSSEQIESDGLLISQLSAPKNKYTYILFLSCTQAHTHTHAKIYRYHYQYRNHVHTRKQNESQNISEKNVYFMQNISLVGNYLKEVDRNVAEVHGEFEKKPCWKLSCLEGCKERGKTQVAWNKFNS